MSPEEVFSLRALWDAAKRAQRGERLRRGIAAFRLDQERILCELREQLLVGSWRPAGADLVSIRDPKPRLISVAPFADRVVYQALGVVLGPRIERRLISDSFASIAGRGPHAALRRARAWARTYRFAVHMDVEKFFPSIDHEIVRSHIARDVPEPWLRALCDRILRGSRCEQRRAWFPGDDLFTPWQRTVGLPLGNLTSQLWANRYLDPIDHLVKTHRARSSSRPSPVSPVLHHAALSDEGTGAHAGAGRA